MLLIIFVLQEPGLEPGDIIIVLDEKEHATFKRTGVDLVMKMDINITEALCGFKKTVATLDNRTLVIQTIPGKFYWLICIGRTGLHKALHHVRLIHTHAASVEGCTFKFSQPNSL